MLLSLFKVASFLFFLTSLVSSLNLDGLSLLAFKAAIESDPTRSLDKWSEWDSNPCQWPGIACTRNRVTSIFLPNKRLTGYIPSELGLLDSLTRLSVSQNNFSKPIPSRLFNATNLIYIDLSHNSLSGPVPPQIKSLKNLTHLDLSANSLNGSLLESLVELKSLTGTLNLSYNKFSGEIPASYGEFPVLINLDLRHNNLTGKVPQVGSLLNQGPTAFSGNPNLCGFPLGNLCPDAQNPGAILNPEENPDDPKGLRPIFNDGNVEKRKEKNGSVVVPLISGVSVLIGAVLVFAWLFRIKWKSGDRKIGKEKKSEEVDEEGRNGKFVVVDEGFNLELEDLLRASAYVVGKSRSGIVYKVKVVAGRGSSTVGTTVVAVRRLSEGDATWKLKEFEAEIEAIGRVNHPNVVRLRAYYYATDEKLLVTDFICNGSLYAALHGGPSNNLPSLSWAERLRIVQGTARGLVYIHEYSPRKYVHGNLKSTKMLLDHELQPYISGFGLTHLVSGTPKYASSITKKLNSTETNATFAVGSRISTPNSYLAPEARVSGNKFTQKCDVYSFGIVLLEILTGRLPDAGQENGEKGLEGLVRKAFREKRPLSEIIDPTLIPQVYAKKQVVAAFHIALNCTELNPELRPRMRSVSESLDRIKSQ
ncbi:receptor protein kinase-like protein ZAR1 [Durio zibethinus]|uniref:Receptor protein kinase-like protein ZAR1 n=1 Tax=Durio zibethinus TaxID=66656 RepID=A0A6P5YU79_DURZI|nr:receptor protein kinase-like protein ZAR1 [Durio zibethinus]